MLQISGDNYPQNEYRIFADFTPCFSYFLPQNVMIFICRFLQIADNYIVTVFVKNALIKSCNYLIISTLQPIYPRRIYFPTQKLPSANISV